MCQRSDREPVVLADVNRDQHVCVRACGAARTDGGRIDIGELWRQVPAHCAHQRLPFTTFVRSGGRFLQCGLTKALADCNPSRRETQFPLPEPADLRSHTPNTLRPADSRRFADATVQSAQGLPASRMRRSDETPAREKSRPRGPNVRVLSGLLGRPRSSRQDRAESWSFGRDFPNGMVASSQPRRTTSCRRDDR